MKHSVSWLKQRIYLICPAVLPHSSQLLTCLQGGPNRTYFTANSSFDEYLFKKLKFDGNTLFYTDMTLNFCNIRPPAPIPLLINKYENRASLPHQQISTLAIPQKLIIRTKVHNTERFFAHIYDKIFAQLRYFLFIWKKKYDGGKW